MRRTAALVAAALLLAGCGDRSSIEEGGRAPGEILTVYAVGADRGFVREAKEALAEAGGQAGRFTVQFATKALPADPDGMADAIEDVVRDVGTIAVIGDFTPAQARVTAPLLNAVGLLQVSRTEGTVPSVRPAARRTFFAVGGGGREAMDAVLGALRRAGDDAARRSAVIEAFATAR